MTPYFRSVRAIAQKDCRSVCFTIPERCRSTDVPTTNPELSYVHNLGTSPLLETTVGKLLENAAGNWPDRECLISLHQKQRLTFSELLKRADKVAAGLKRIGLKRGDRIGIWGPNDLEWLVAYMATARVGLIAAGINPLYQQSEVDYCVRKIGVKAVIAPYGYMDQKYADMLLTTMKTSPSLDHIIIYSDDHVTGTRRFKDVEELSGRKDVEAIKEEQVDISPYSATNIQFTSGTTGSPKATLSAHRSLVNNSRQIMSRLQVDGLKICLNIPFFHAFAMINGVTGCLHAGTTIILENRTFNPVKSIEAIVQEKCSVALGTPTMWINMMDVQAKQGIKIDSLCRGVTGGAPASPEFFRRVRENMGFERMTTIYGQTEALIVNQTMPDEPPEVTENTIGYISDHIEMKVIDENENIVSFGTPGELCVRGYSTMMGYWGDEENTKRTLTEDGWLRTGDTYILRKDGYGQIIGRLKDMLIRGGENIFPKEIEDFLESHPNVLEVHAFGVHDDVYGEEICACIRLKEGAKVSVEDVRSYCKGKIAKFKIPRHVVFRDDFPKTTTGKIQKFKLKEELEDRGVVPKKPQ